jgi:hypothetical protein
MADLIPPDPNQCQALIQEGSFMTLGPRPWVRCTSKPTVIATERKAGSDGERGSMSLCDSCKGAMIEKLGHSFADFAPIPMYDVTVYDGKYRYVMHQDGKTEVFRHGEPWNRDVTGDGFVLALVQEVDELRKKVKELEARLNPGVVVP